MSRLRERKVAVVFLISLRTVFKVKNKSLVRDSVAT